MQAQPNQIVETLLSTLGFKVSVASHNLPEGLVLDITAEDPGRLIGRQGQTLGDIQYLTNRILFHQDPSSPKVTVDIGGYRLQARETLMKKAREAAEKVRRWGDAVELEPMSAFDRRIVHQALHTDPDVETHSVEVEGSEKKVLILRPRKH